MRIGQVISNLEAGGAERFVTDLSVELARRGHGVGFIVVDRWTGSPAETAARARLEAAGVEARSLGRRVGSGWRMLGALGRGLAALRGYEVVHSHLPLADGLAGAARAAGGGFRHVVTVHSTRQEWAGWSRRGVRGAAVVYCSRAVQRRHAARLGEGRVILNGIGLDAFRPGAGDGRAAREGLGAGREAALIIGVGNLNPIKNYPCVFEALAMLRARRPGLDFQYVVCGEGGERGGLEAAIGRLGLLGRARLLGARGDVAELLRAADVFVSASTCEGLPIAVLEALAGGVRCVLSPIEEHAETAEGMAGCWLARENAPEAIAEAIEEALGDGSNRDGHADLAGRRAGALERFSIKACARQYEEVYSCLTR